MNIVIDARESGSTTGRYIDKLIEYLHELKPKHDITVLTKAHRIDKLKRLAPHFRIIESPYKEFTTAEQWGLKEQLERLKPDLVHFGMTQQPIFYHGKSITTIHDLTTIRFNNPDKNPLVFAVKQQVYRYVIKKAAKKSVKLITISEFVSRDIQNYTGVGKDKLTITYEAADHIPDKPRMIEALNKHPFIMYVGRPTPHKNLPRLIQAFKQLQQTHPNLRLVLVGKHDTNYQQLEDQTKKQGITNVIFTGFVEEGELRWLYENTLAYVFPSLSEGFGLPPLEAMVHGAPVVSSNATCLPEINGDAAEYFDPTDTNDMARAIVAVTNNDKRRQALIKKGHAQVKKYSWRRMAEQTLEVYEQALKD